ncbi:hypothetical protein diail_1842, partial [Diaporthe ilicicola]
TGNQRVESRYIRAVFWDAHGQSTIKQMKVVNLEDVNEQLLLRLEKLKHKQALVNNATNGQIDELHEIVQFLSGELQEYQEEVINLTKKLKR